MAYMQSPGIQIKEFDISGYIPGVSASVAGIGGVFSWGPVEERVLISDEATLVNRFGRPTDDNFETFMIAANYLSYSNALYVSRAADNVAVNAATGDDVPAVQIKNLNDFTVKQDSLSANATFYAKYPAEIGNSLKISVCASADAYNSNIALTSETETMTLEFTPGEAYAQLTVVSSETADDANTAINSVISKLNVGDFIAVRNGGNVQYVQLNSVGTVTTDAGTASASVILRLANRYTLAEPVTVDSIDRYWEYFNLFDKAPGTSTYTAERGGTGDEMHIVVVDRLGKFTGLPNQILEVYPNLSRATDARSESGTAAYYKTVLNDSSAYVYANADIPGVVSDLAENMTAITVDVYTANFTGGADSSSESTINLGALARAYDQFASKEDVDVSILIAGKATGGVFGEGLANYIIDNIAEVRRDCVVTVSPPIDAVVNANGDEVDRLIDFRRAIRYSGRAFITSAYKYQFDRYNNKNRWVAGCGDDAGLMARTDFDRDPWWSPAGENRGMYKNIIKLAFNPNKAQRDALYKEDINPVVNLAGAGVILYGDKTALGKPSAFDRINVRRLFDTLEKAIEKYARSLLFEFNDQYTQARFRNTVEPYLRDVKARRGITRFKVICDASNNPPAVVDRNEFVGSIYIVPAKSINSITLNFVAVANTVSFEYAIGEVDGVAS